MTEQMTTPRLSIVIASCVGPPFITRCLAALFRQLDRIGDTDVEVIVADRAGGEVADTIEREFPRAQLVRRPPAESVPDLRRHGICKARAPHVAIIEEHCVARDDWVATLLGCVEQPVAAVGGPVDDDGYRRLMDWAVYFTEYNSYMPPVERGETRDVCAANCVYRRDLLVEHLPAAGSGYWEAGLNHTLLASGKRFLIEPDLVVRHTGPFGLFYYLRQRFLFSRAFGGTRRDHMRPPARLAYLVMAPLLAPLLLARTARRVFAKRHRVGKFLAALPLLIPITITYVAGEWLGLLLGPGDSLSKIE